MFSSLEERLDHLEEELRNENKELREELENLRNPPFGYFCSFQEKWTEADSVITYDKLLYSSQFGLQGDSPGIDINTGKFVTGFSGTWRVDFSLVTYPHYGEYIHIFLYKNGVQIPETDFYSYRTAQQGGEDVNTGGRSLLLHLEVGDELHLGTTLNDDSAYEILFCVALEQFDVDL